MDTLIPTLFRYRGTSLVRNTLQEGNARALGGGLFLTSEVTLRLGMTRRDLKFSPVPPGPLVIGPCITRYCPPSALESS